MQKKFELELFGKDHKVTLDLNNYVDANLLLMLIDTEDFVDSKSVSVVMEKLEPVINSKTKLKHPKTKRKSSVPVKKKSILKSHHSTIHSHSPRKKASHKSSSSNEEASLFDYSPAMSRYPLASTIRSKVNQESHFLIRKPLPVNQKDIKCKAIYASMNNLKEYQKYIRTKQDQPENNKIKSNKHRVAFDPVAELIEPNQMFRSRFKDIRHTPTPKSSIRRTRDVVKSADDNESIVKRKKLPKTTRKEGHKHSKKAKKFEQWLNNYNLTKNQLVVQDSKDKFHIRSSKKLNAKNELENLNSDKYVLKRTGKSKPTFKNLNKSLRETSNQ